MVILKTFVVLDFLLFDNINEFTLFSLIKKVHYLCIIVKMKHRYRQHRENQ
jgi:hypothetical protein